MMCPHCTSKIPFAATRCPECVTEFTLTDLWAWNLKMTLISWTIIALAILGLIAVFG